MPGKFSANLDVLKADTDSAIRRMTRYQRGNKRKAELAVVISASISAATTISIGLSSLIPVCSTIFQSAAMVLSASLTIVIAWGGLHNHKRQWMLQSSVINALYRIQTEIKHLEASPQIDQAAVDTLYGCYRAAIDEYGSQGNDFWGDDRRSSAVAGSDGTAT